MLQYIMNENLRQSLRDAGAAAFANNDPRALPYAEVATEWLAGWDAANIAAPVPGWTAEENAAYVAAVAPKADVSPIGDGELADFVQAVQNNILSIDRVSYPNLNDVKMGITWGQKFARVVTSRNADSSDRSVYCFVELSTGNIYKPAGWKAPAKHARGNIRQGDQSNWWNGALNSVGVRYLR